jgi:hypothetical protein
MIAPTLVFEGPSIHPTVSFLFFFLLGFDLRKIDYLLNSAYGFLASLGPRNVYKDMLNKMVSPNDHVVMNHQNQTRTNGIWGHVRYKNRLLVTSQPPATRFWKIEYIFCKYLLSSEQPVASRNMNWANLIFYPKTHRRPSFSCLLTPYRMCRFKLKLN